MMPPCCLLSSLVTVQQYTLFTTTRLSALYELIINNQLMFDNKVALYCTLVPEVIYFHLIRKTSSSTALKAGSQCVFPFIQFVYAHKWCDTENNERCLKAVSCSYTTLIDFCCYIKWAWNTYKKGTI